MEKSLFMQDSSRSNHGYEAMLDYQISWLLRLAKEEKRLVAQNSTKRSFQVD